MKPKYTVCDDERFMVHTNKRMSYETSCDGCGVAFNHESFVTVITDRSGSEYGAVHVDDANCIRKGIVEVSR